MGNFKVDATESYWFPGRDAPGITTARAWGPADTHLAYGKASLTYGHADAVTVRVARETKTEFS